MKQYIKKYGVINLKKDINQSIKLFTDYCIKNGFNKELFLNEKNIDEYAKTAANGYIGYPVMDVNFNGKYDEHLFYRMLRIDFKSRLNKSIGIASENYESVLIIEAPMATIALSNIIGSHFLFLIISSICFLVNVSFKIINIRHLLFYVFPNIP